ncbi:hypothetical protein [Halomicrobium katesii]|uniref:hypothetical protein n=1 Tax=Halomicrobium katesii TaxID=437163 RepID=UPI000378D802|nr:hypothetical protein [Halomicrobium katesii]
MATHSARPGDEDRATLPDAVPFELPILTRLSWELGALVDAPGWDRVDDTVRY